MSSLFIDRRGISLSLDGGALVFRENGERVGTVPTAPLDRVFIQGGVTVDTSVLNRLGSNGVGVVIIDGRRNELRMYLPPAHNDAERRLAQYVLSIDDDFCRQEAIGIVRDKLLASRDGLEALELEHELHDAEYSRQKDLLCMALNRLDAMTSLDAIRGIEGQGAAAYFAALARLLPPPLSFTGRNKRPPQDPFNATISLAYTLLAAEAGLALHAAGLDPYVGFLHKLDYGRPSLSCDLMEPAWPLADQFAVGLFEKKVLRPEDFSTTGKGCFMSKTARSRFYPAYEAASGAWRRILEQKAYALAERLTIDFRMRHQRASCRRIREGKLRLNAGDNSTSILKDVSL